MSNKKHYPRVPQCLTNDNCSNCPSKKDDKTDSVLKKCLNCGVTRTSFILGGISELREQTKHYIAFFEKIL